MSLEFYFDLVEYLEEDEEGDSKDSSPPWEEEDSEEPFSYVP